jgi:hypothetical protein
VASGVAYVFREADRTPAPVSGLRKAGVRRIIRP